MGHQSYEDSVKLVTKTILLLGAITLFEVFFALLGKGYISDSVHFPLWVVGGVMIALSLVKAYYIVYEFMHMKYEVPGMVKSVVLPTLLLVWAIIAFFWEGSDWKKRRSLIDDKNTGRYEQQVPQGFLILDNQTKKI